MVTYTISICNYNMAETIEVSLRSVLDQLTEEFEVLVVDGGSTDGSMSILRELETEYSILRVLALERDEDRTLGEQRDISVQEARGDYILLHIDADDRYDEIILDLVELYHQLEEKLNFELALVGCHITMLRREFLLEIGSYRHLHYAEDNDLWRRLVAEDALIWVDTKCMFEEIGYEKHIRDQMKRSFQVQISNFQSGISYMSFIKYVLSNYSLLIKLFALVVSPVTYLLALQRERYSSSIELTKWHRERKKRTMDISQIEERYGIQITKERFSEQGAEMLYIDTTG